MLINMLITKALYFNFQIIWQVH